MVQKAERDPLGLQVSEGRKGKWVHQEPLEHWGHRAHPEHPVFKGPLDLEALRVYLENWASLENLGPLVTWGHLERMGWMDHQACPAPRENQGTLGTVVHLECPDLGEELGSRALPVILARRGKLAFPELQASQDCVERKETREKRVNWDFLG